MPFYPGAVANELHDYTDEIQAYARDDEGVVAKYRNALRDALAEYESDRLRDELDPHPQPGAAPTSEWDERENPVVPFDAAASWDNHEAINRFAKGVLEGVTTVAADGSELGPTEEFTVPLGLVQVAWTANHHDTNGDYDGDIHTHVLGPETVTVESNGKGIRYTDGRVPGHERYRKEGKTVVECIQKFADHNPTPVIIYDGPLVPLFANTYAPDVRDVYYRETMAQVLAASEHHGVPVVGYTAGTKRTNVAKMLQRTYHDRLGDEPLIADARILDSFTENWGDRSLTFVNRWGETVDELATTYQDTEYGFAEEVLFTYLDVPNGGAMDYLEFPEWVQREGLVEHVFDVVRAETGVGRGYPEILQQADTNAVLDAGAKRKFLSLVQEFAEAEDLPIEWDVKALSKERRRR